MEYPSLKLIFLCIVVLLTCLQFHTIESRPAVDANNAVRSKSNHLNDMHSEVDARKNNRKLSRSKRQFDFTIDADHEDGLGTDLMASAQMNLFKTDRSRLDGTARYSQHFSDFAGHGKAKIGGSLHFSHQY